MGHKWIEGQQKSTADLVKKMRVIFSVISPSEARNVKALLNEMIGQGVLIVPEQNIKSEVQNQEDIPAEETVSDEVAEVVRYILKAISKRAILGNFTVMPIRLNKEEHGNGFVLDVDNGKGNLEPLKGDYSLEVVESALQLFENHPNYVLTSRNQNIITDNPELLKMMSKDKYLLSRSIAVI